MARSEFCCRLWLRGQAQWSLSAGFGVEFAYLRHLMCAAVCNIVQFIRFMSCAKCSATHVTTILLTHTQQWRPGFSAPLPMAPCDLVVVPVGEYTQPGGGCLRRGLRGHAVWLLSWTSMVCACLASRCYRVSRTRCSGCTVLACPHCLPPMAVASWRLRKPRTCNTRSVRRSAPTKSSCATHRRGN